MFSTVEGHHQYGWRISSVRRRIVHCTDGISPMYWCGPLPYWTEHPLYWTEYPPMCWCYPSTELSISLQRTEGILPSYWCYLSAILNSLRRTAHSLPRGRCSSRYATILLLKQRYSFQDRILNRNTTRSLLEEEWANVFYKFNSP